jgi:glutathione peroxidase
MPDSCPLIKPFINFFINILVLLSLYKLNMKKLIVLFFLSVFILHAFPQDTRVPSIYNFIVTSLDGKDYSFKQLIGKKVMIVNTASKCGFTPQYEQLESLYKEYGGDKFVIIGFPANNFLSQEPGTNAQIREFCDAKFGVTFPMMSKISVKGSDMHPLYKWLTDKKLNGVLDSEVKWNFQKYLIDEKGALVSVIPPKVSPRSEEIIQWLKN